jgi:hypothetical protein
LTAAGKAFATAYNLPKKAIGWGSFLHGNELK